MNLKTRIELVNNIEIVNTTRAWIAEFVVGLNICPFAKHPYNLDIIGYHVFAGSDLEEGLRAVAQQLHLLEKTPTSELETTLILFPGMLEDFEDYLSFLDLSESLLLDLKLEGILQIASFHPAYQFEGTEKDDISNYTNRSPYPMIHLIREDSVYAARQHHPDIESIPQRNIDLLQSMTIEEGQKYIK